ncbi:hypothetical protein L249_6812, partial [Ophiocordyceps polyrhachis-furcata BCC 54312]
MGAERGAVHDCRGDIQLAIYTIYKYRVCATPVELPQRGKQALRYPYRARAQANVVDKANVRSILIIEVADQDMVRRDGLLRPLLQRHCRLQVVTVEPSAGLPAHRTDDAHDSSHVTRATVDDAGSGAGKADVGGRNAGGRIAVRGLVEDDVGLGAVVLILHARCARHGLALLAMIPVSLDDGGPAGTGAQVLDGDPSRAQDGRRAAQAIDDGALDTDATGSAVEDKLDPAAQVVDDVLGRGGRRAGRRVCGGGGDGDVGELYEGQGERRGRYTDAKGRKAGRNLWREGRRFRTREQYSQGPWPEAVDEGPIDGRQFTARAEKTTQHLQ